MQTTWSLAEALTQNSSTLSTKREIDKNERKKKIKITDLKVIWSLSLWPFPPLKNKNRLKHC